MAREHRGWRVVLVGYAVVVSVAGLLGFVVGLVEPEGARPVDVLGLVVIEPTPFGLAFWGVLSVGTLLGVGLVLVVAVSRYADVERSS